MRHRLWILAMVTMVSLVAAPTAVGAVATTTAKVKAADISLEYPSSWYTAPVTKKAIAAQTKLLKKTNPKLAAALAESGVDASQFKLRAINPEATGETVGVQLIEGQGSPGSLSDYKSAVIPGFEAVGATVLAAKTLKVSGKTAYRIDVTLPITLPDGSKQVTRLGQLVIPEGDDTVSINVAAIDDAAGQELVDDILGSVRRL